MLLFLIKKYFLIIPLVLFALIFSLFSTRNAHAQNDTGWTIESFKADVRINPNTDVYVTETIIADFDGLAKHGIYRDIPVSYQTGTGNNLNIRLSLLGVTDAKGQKIQTKVSRKGKNISIRIGDPNLSVSGRNIYVISYKVSQVITTPGQNAELYWNVTGNDWTVPILEATANIYAPEGSLIKSVCFTGQIGSQDSNCDATNDKNTANSQAKNIYPGEGLTVAVAMDKNAFKFPPFYMRLIYLLSDNLLYFVPLVVFIIMFRLYLLKGRDREFKNIFREEEGTKTSSLFEKLNSISVSVNPPKDLSPGEVGTLVDEFAHLKDITATVIDLARRGFLKITENPKKGLFGKSGFVLDYVKKDEGELKPYEISVLDMLFSSKRNIPAVLSKLHPNAYESLKEAEKNLYEDLTSREYFLGRPDDIRNKYLIAGVLIVAVTVFFGGFISSFISSPSSFYFATISSGIIIIAFSFFMPARTAKGRKALMEIVGFREVLRLGAWREKIYEKHNFFEEVLPYAIAFGITEKFIKAFKDAEIKDVSWYKGAHPLNVIYFNNAMNSFGGSLGAGVNASRPKSAAGGGSGFGGGGFSGGGFGGGGGGSW